MDENAGIISFLNPFAQLRSQDFPNMARDHQEDLVPQLFWFITWPLVKLLTHSFLDIVA